MIKLLSLFILISIVNFSNPNAQTPTADDEGPKFGPEFTFYAPSTYDDREDIVRRMTALIRVKFIEDRRYGNRFVSLTQNGFLAPGQWHFYLKTDPGVVEVETGPLTVKGFESHSEEMQTVIFDTAAELGHFPAPFAGGGHISIDLNYLGARPVLLRNFLIDLYVNHVELSFGVMGYDTNNALPLIQLNPSLLAKIDQAIRLSSTKETLRLLQKLSQSDDRRPDDFLKFWKAKNRDEGGFAIRFSDFVGDQLYPTSRLELRFPRPQASIEVWIRQIRLLRNRLRYLADTFKTVQPTVLKFNLLGRRASDPYDVSHPALNPPISGMQALENFKVFVEESGENIEDHLDYVWPAWQSDGTVQAFKRKYGLGRSCSQLLRGPV